MDWDWEQQRLLSRLRSRVAAGATPNEILDRLHDAAWPLTDAWRALEDLCGVGRARAAHTVSLHPAYRAISARNAALHDRLRTAADDAERVQILLNATEGPAGRTRDVARDAAIDGLAARLGIAVPAELRAWLRLANGATGGYGGFFGVQPRRPRQDIEDTLAGHPHLFARGWLPIADDGCGSIYVLALQDATRSGSAVLYLDWEASASTLFDRASFVVASGLWPFLRLRLMQDLDLLDWSWPFDRVPTLREDPALMECRSAPLPWEV